MRFRGWGHVVTKFAHLYYIPLVPLDTQFVVTDYGGKWHGTSLGLNAKSVLLAWLRAGLLVASVFAIISTFAIAGDVKPNKELVAVCAVISAVLVAACLAVNFMKPFRQASYTRAKDLSIIMGFSDEAKVLVDLVYNVISEQEAERRYDALAEKKIGS